MAGKIEISIVVPVYGSEDIFAELYRRLEQSLSPITDAFEIVAVVDGSPDRVAEVVAAISRQDSRVRLIELARNFGHQAAVTAGLEYAGGEMVVIIDDDLEDPPEVIPEFIAKANEGYDVVYGIRRKRSASFFRRIAYYTFYRVLNTMTSIDLPLDSGDFCLMKRPVVDQLNDMPESNRYLRGMRAWLGFRQIGVEYERGSRYAGTSGYTLSRYFRFALDGILSFSYRPLEYVSIMGLIFASISFVLGTRLVLLRTLDRTPEVPGWTSLMVVVLFLGGIQLISVGIIGEYVARIYDEVKNRPHYVIKRDSSIPEKLSQEAERDQ